MFNSVLGNKYVNSIWTDDNSVNSCHNCKIDFTFLNRRHHCRLCGKIFCSVCTDNYIYTGLPNKLIIIEDFLMESLSNNNLQYKKKVCYQCYNLLLNIREIARLIKIFELLPLDVLQMSKLLYVNKNFNKGILFYLNNFKNIQYTTISNSLSTKMYNILLYNKFNICGHNKLITQFIINNDWSKYNNSDLINILDNLQKRKVSCKILLCGNCSEKLTNYDILYILKYTKNIFLKQYLLERLNIDISNYLPLLISYIKNDNNNDLSITKYIISKCKSITLLIELFLQMFIIINNDNLNIYKTALQYIKDTIKKSDNSRYESIINSIKLINLINNINLNLRDSYINDINDFIKNNKVYIPLGNEDVVESISQNIVIKNSNTKPIIIEIIYKNRSKKCILFKKEDIRTDYIICKIIGFIKNILKINKIDTNLITYNVLPINNSAGLIEIVDDSYTLYDINETMNITLQNFILNNNKTQTVDIMKKKFINSLAIYSIITYVLGIGDRHLDNIMITKSGVLFHIDFSFCVGYDPKPFYPSMRITNEMIEMIGGENSDDYKRFIKKCNIYYNVIRKYTNIISLMIFLLNEVNKNTYNILLIKNHIIKKFIYGESDHYANSRLEDNITNSTNNYNYIDFFHYHSKEKTVSKTVFNLYDNSILLSSYLKKYVSHF